MSDGQKPSESLLELNVQSSLRAINLMDGENPTGGHVEGTGLKIEWQNGPRGTGKSGELKAPNGAFVEDAIWAALQRLEFFQSSKYADPANAVAISNLHQALEALNVRRKERAARGVEGEHKV